MLRPQLRVPDRVPLVPDMEAVTVMVSAPFPAIRVSVVPLTLPCSTVIPQIGFAARPVTDAPLWERNKPLPEDEITQFPATEAGFGAAF